MGQVNLAFLQSSYITVTLHVVDYTAYPEALLVKSLGQVRICYWRVGKSGVPFQCPVDVEEDILSIVIDCLKNVRRYS